MYLAVASLLLLPEAAAAAAGNPFRSSASPLRNRSLRVGLIPDKDGYEYDCRGYYDATGLRSVDSYSEYILALLREVLGFRVELIATNTWGSRVAGGNWTGLVGLARSGLIDLGACHSTITRERREEVDFLLSTMLSTRSFAYEPSRLSLSRDVFIQTFTPELWLCFFASISLLVVSFRFSTYQHSRWRPDHEPWSWVEVAMWANAAVCQQSYSRHPKGSSCRTTFLIGYLITYLLYTGFAAGVTSLLAVQGLHSRLSFREVLLTNLNLVLQSDGTHLDFLEHSADADARALRSSRLLTTADTLSEVFAKLHDREDFVGLGSTVALSNYLGRRMPSSRMEDIALSRIPRSNHHKAFVVPKKSPHRETFNYWLLRLMESGLLERGTRRYVDAGQVRRPIGWSSAGLGNVSSAVVIFAGGCFASVVVLFAEIARKRRSESIEWEVAGRREVLGIARRRPGNFHNKLESNPRIS